MDRSRKAFTLIEILVVIAILAVLISIVAYGMSRVTGHTKISATRATLSNLRSMLSEFETTARGLTRQPDHLYFGGAIYSSTATPIDIWQDADPNTAGQQPLVAPDGSVAIEAVSATHTTRYTADGIANTQQVMTQLLQSANNKDSLQRLPPTQLMEALPSPTTPSNLIAVNQRFTPPIVLDPWGNPILFVPSAGLYNVTAGDVLHNKTPTNPGGNDGPVQSPDHRPFWVSAGPDGDFQKADDNIYSFEE